jgi:tRNA nucleotidyltransferase (CCA-adding enzyme)
MNFPTAVQRVLTQLTAAGHEAYAVGGCVRDLLLGRVPDDWDITTSARPEETMALFPGRCIPTGLQHGTVTVRQDGASLEVTTFRTDGPYADGRHPRSVTFTRSLEEDLARRDFTVNAMAMDASGALRDPWGGRADLAAGRIRCVGDPARRLSEDALRILRALRFAAVLGFTVEEGTARALRASRSRLDHIAAERLRVELTKLLCGPRAAEVLRAFPEVVGAVLPEVLPMVGFDQRNPHHCYDVWEHTLHALAAAAPDPVLRWTILFHDIGKPNTFTVDVRGTGHFYGHGEASTALASAAMRRLKFDNDSRRRIELLVAWHDRNIPRTRRGIRRALHALGEEALGQLLAVKRADNLAQAPASRNIQTELDKAEAILGELLAERACFSLGQMAVDGRDMMALGLRGPAIGQMLRALLEQVLEEELPNERTALLAWAAAHRAD